MKFHVCRTFALALLSAYIPTAQANSHYGLTGLLTIPTAQTLQFGEVQLGYNNFLNPYYQNYPNRRGQNFIIGLSPIPGLELFTRLAEVHKADFNPHQYGDFDSRDLVGNIKYQLPISRFMPKPFGIEPKLAIGANDIAGLAVHERRVYVAATFEHPWLDLTLGYAKEDKQNSIHNAMLIGRFGGLNIKPTNWLEAQWEHDGFEKRAGLQLSCHNCLNSPLNLQVGSTLYTTQPQQEKQFSFSLSYPFNQPALPHNFIPPTTQQAMQAADNKETIEPPQPLLPKPTLSAEAPQIPNTDSQYTNRIEALQNWAQAEKQALEKMGLEHIRIAVESDSHANKHLHLFYQNQLFVQGDLAALSALIQQLKQEQTTLNQFHSIHLWTLQNNQPTVLTQFSPKWLAKQTSAIWVSYNHTPPTTLTTLAQSASNQATRLNITLSPSLVYHYGHEYGVMDYSLALNTQLDTPIWQGGQLSITYQSPASASYYYQNNRIFSADKHQANWREVSVNHTSFPTQNTINLSSLGQINIDHQRFAMLRNQTYWLPNAGQHQVYTEFAWLKQLSPLQSAQTPQIQTRTLGIAGYEYYWAKQQLAFNYETGQYFNQDRCDKITLKTFFGQSIFSVQYSTSNAGWDKITAGLTIPLWGTHKLKAANITLSGTPNWQNTLSTVINNPLNKNANWTKGTAGYIDTGIRPQFNHSIQQDNLAANRFTPAHIKQKLANLNQ